MHAQSRSGFLILTTKGASRHILIRAFHNPILEDVKKVIGKAFQKEFEGIGFERSMRKRIGHKVILEFFREVLTVSSLAIEINHLSAGHIFEVGDNRKYVRKQENLLVGFIFFFILGEEELEADSSGLFGSGHEIADFTVKGVRSSIEAVLFMRALE